MFEFRVGQEEIDRRVFQNLKKRHEVLAFSPKDSQVTVLVKLGFAIKTVVVTWEPWTNTLYKQPMFVMKVQADDTAIKWLRIHSFHGLWEV